jgi:3-oxoacyl-[acyl-carrier protein] reductase
MAPPFDHAAFDYSGKIALVTGSSRGIGAGLVEAFARAGARCVVNYVADPAGRNKADAETVAAGLKDAILVECDVAADASVAAMMQQVRDRLGGLDILVNNAGILRDRTIRKMTPDDWDAVMRVNLTGPFNCIRHATATGTPPLLREGGRIVNISSLSAFAGMFGQANYASSKAGIVALTKVAARELAKQRITVNAIAPGVIDTEILSAVPDEIKKKYLEQIPLARFGQVDDVVNAALFLCSPLASYVTGQVLHVNGGMLMP